MVPDRRSAASLMARPRAATSTAASLTLSACPR